MAHIPGTNGSDQLTGTPFYALPEHWTCPQCGGERSQFLVLPGE